MTNPNKKIDAELGLDIDHDPENIIGRPGDPDPVDRRNADRVVEYVELHTCQHQ